VGSRFCAPAQRLRVLIFFWTRNYRHHEIVARIIAMLFGFLTFLFEGRRGNYVLPSSCRWVDGAGRTFTPVIHRVTPFPD
jgi:hypothetical protein